MFFENYKMQVLFLINFYQCLLCILLDCFVLWRWFHFSKETGIDICRNALFNCEEIWWKNRLSDIWSLVSSRLNFNIIFIWLILLGFAFLVMIRRIHLLFASHYLHLICFLWLFARLPKLQEYMLENHLDHLEVFLSNCLVASGTISSNFWIHLWVDYVIIKYVECNIAFLISIVFDNVLVYYLLFVFVQTICKTVREHLGA